MHPTILSLKMICVLAGDACLAWARVVSASPARCVIMFVDESWDWESQYNCNHFEIALSREKQALFSSEHKMRTKKRK
jgi:hypothetical protein